MASPISIPCPQVIRDCECTDDPITNYSSEDPDQPVFFGHFDQPPNNGTWFAPGCQSICESLVSQQAADECAARQAIECSFDGAPDDGNPLPGGGRTAPRFGNELESCESACPEGSSVTFLVAPGTVISATQADANARAHGLACKLAQDQRVCFTTASPLMGVCIDDFFSVVFDAEGGTEPYTFALDSGAIPPGTEFNAQGNLFGTPTATGNFTFVVRVTDAVGTESTKEFTLLVIEITSPTQLTSGTVSIAYTEILTQSGGTAPIAWSIIDGALPPGLLLAADGSITGTPTSPGTYTFTAQLVAGNAVCSKFLRIFIAGACGAATDWGFSPGNCRPRIQSFNAADFAGGMGCDVTAISGWDGTFPTFVPGAGSDVGEYRIAGFNASQKYVRLTFINGLFGNGTWRLEIRAPLVPGPATTVFRAASPSTAQSDPDITGTYTKDMGCTGPATLVIEGYLP